MKKVTNKELIDYCNSCGEICSAIHCEYYVECRAYHKRYGSIPYKNQLFRPECYTDEVIVLETDDGWDYKSYV